MKKTSIFILVCLILNLFSFNSVFAYTDVKITLNGQVVDTFAGVNAIYATLSSYSNVDSNTTYSCAAFLKKFCSTLWGVTIYNINTVNAAPTVSKSGHSVYLKSVSSPQPGDIMQTKNYSHVAIVKSVNGSNVTLIEQNWSYNSNGYRYARKDRVISTSSAYFYRMMIDGKEATVPGYSTTPPKSIPQISSITGNGSDVTVAWNSVSDAEKYTIDFWNAETGVHNYFSTTSTSITKSLPDAHYGIRLVAVNSAGEGTYTSFHYFWVLKSEVPEVPQIMNVDVSGKSVTVTWEATDKTNLYTVDFWNAETGVHNYYKTNATTITQTLPTAQYGIRICSENTAGSSAFSRFYYVYAGEYHISFDANGGTMNNTYRIEKTIDAINEARTADTIIAYTSGDTTETNQYGFEVIVNSDGLVTDTNYYVGNSAIPSGGMVLSGHGSGCVWLDENIKVGDYVKLDTENKLVRVYSATAWKTINKTVGYGEQYNFLPTPTKDGYIFDGWYTAAEGGEKITEETIVVATAEHTLYAHWAPIDAHTSTTVNDNLFNIKCTNVENGNRVILALYKDKKFVKLYEKTYQGEDIPFTVTEDYDEAKVMVWEALSTPKPVTAVETIK